MNRFEAGYENRLINYLMKEDYYNVYLLSNLKNYGLMDNNVEFFSNCDEEGNYSVILMRFFNSFVIYSEKDDFDINDVIKEIYSKRDKFDALSCITGKYSTVKCMARNEADVRNTSILVLYADNDYLINNSGLNISVYNKTSIDKIYAHYCLIDEMSDKYRKDELKAKKDINNNLDSGRLFGIEKDGKIISSIMTTAESDTSAMLINVCTQSEYREIGLCNSILNYLCSTLFLEGKQKLYIYYENEKAGNIYKKAGFRYVGDYGRIPIGCIKKCENH